VLSTHTHGCLTCGVFVDDLESLLGLCRLVLCGSDSAFSEDNVERVKAISGLIYRRFELSNAILRSVKISRVDGCMGEVFECVDHITAIVKLFCKRESTPIGISSARPVMFCLIDICRRCMPGDLLPIVT
jgi:hypothetical protein